MPARVVIGKFTLESLTTGMYSDPRSVYREYIQNATDSIDEAVIAGQIEKRDGRIDLQLDKTERTISIRDNGLGINPRSAWSVLTDIGNSRKRHDTSRGFRGIGRLGGVSYCERLVFETSTTGSRDKATIAWDCSRLRELVQPGRGDSYNLEDVIREVVTETIEPWPEDESFFQVTMEGITLDSLLDEDDVKSYLAQVAPVPFNSTRFVYGPDIRERLVALGHELEEYNIYVNDDFNPLYKPYKTWFRVNGKRDEVRGVEFVEARDSEGHVVLLFWYARTGWMGQVDDEDKETRGLRLRKRNIQIGDETTLDGVFGALSKSAVRFNKWCIGEVYVFNNVVPNARRDNFEENAEYVRFRYALDPCIKTVYRIPSRMSTERSNVKAMADARKLIDEVKNEVKKGISSETQKQQVYQKLDRSRKKLSKLANTTPTRRPGKSEPGVTYEQAPDKREFVSEAKKAIKELHELENQVINSQRKTERIPTSYPKEVRKAIQIVFDVIDRKCTCANSNTLTEAIIDALIAQKGHKK